MYRYARGYRDFQRKTNVVALIRSAATLLYDSYQEIDAENVETEKLVGNAAWAIKDNIRTLDQPFNNYASPEDVSIDKLESQIPPFLLTS